MRRAVKKIKPTNGFSRIFHWLFVILVPILALMFVRWSILPLAYGVVVLSKWRMFPSHDMNGGGGHAVPPRYQKNHQPTEPSDSSAPIRVVDISSVR